MFKAFGVTVTVTQPGASEPTIAPLVVVARDERDAEDVAEKAAGAYAIAETLRELTNEEISGHGLDLQVHGATRALPILNL